MSDCERLSLGNRLHYWTEAALVEAGLYEIHEWGEILGVPSTTIRTWLSGRDTPSAENTRDIRIVLDRNFGRLSPDIASKLKDLEGAQYPEYSVLEYSLQPIWQAIYNDLRFMLPREREALLLRFSKICLDHRAVPPGE